MVPKTLGTLMRACSVAAARRSGMPQFCTVCAPPSSNAPIDPTIANELPHAVVAACWSPLELVWLSSSVSASLRPQIDDAELKYATNALIACCAPANNPGTGPLTSATFASVIVELVMPVVFLKPAQLPIVNPAAALPGLLWPPVLP